MNDKFFMLFGCKIPIPGDEAGPSHVQEPDRVPHDLSPQSGALVPIDATPTLPTNTTTHDYDDMDTDSDGDNSGTDDSESDVLIPEPLQSYNRVERVRPIRRRRRRAPLLPRNDLSPEFLEMISPAQPFFLYRKHLDWSDVDRHQNRLLVTHTDRLKEFLTEEENAKSRINVIAFDDHEREYNMTLSKWGEKHEKKSVVLNMQWNLMLRTNGVVATDYVDVWGFRRDREESTNEFCLAVAFSRG